MAKSGAWLSRCPTRPLLYMAVFSYTSERIASNIKYAYLSALFNKSIHFFEQNHPPHHHSHHPGQ